MEKLIDAKGLECPKPVLLTKAAIDAGERALAVTVDNPAAVENVTRLAQSCGFAVQTEQKAGEFTLRLQADAAAVPVQTTVTPVLPVESLKNGWVLFVSHKTIGGGDQTLGGNLMRMFFYTLNETADLPTSILLMNEGIFCTIEDEQLISHLQSLEQKGVQVLVCGTCLNFYGVADRRAVGKVSNMYDILSAMQSTGKVVTL